MNVKFNGGGTFIFPNTFVVLPRTRRLWAKRGVCAFFIYQHHGSHLGDGRKEGIRELLGKSQVFGIQRISHVFSIQKPGIPQTEIWIDWDEITNWDDRVR